jgi:hypothetical protein
MKHARSTFAAFTFIALAVAGRAPLQAQGNTIGIQKLSEKRFRPR